MAMTWRHGNPTAHVAAVVPAPAAAEAPVHAATYAIIESRLFFFLAVVPTTPPHTLRVP